MKHFFSWMALILLILSSCEDAFFEDDVAEDPIANFEFLWETMHQRYSLFEFKQVDWDSVYQVYRPLVTEQTSPDQLFTIMADMLNSLRDGHTNLWSPIDISRFFPYLDAPSNYDADLIERNYLDDYRITGFMINDVLDDVGYIYYRSFTLNIANWELDTIINSFRREDVKGVIIDIRDNGGGNPENGLRMLARMIDERTHIYTSQQKNGPGPTEYADEQQIFLDPSDRPHFPGQVVVLTNRTVYSAGSYFSAGAFAIPDVILIGDRTGGGSGVPAGFELPNGWHCNYSSTIGTLVSGENFEDGVPPDIKIDMDISDRTRGVDTILEKALEVIRGR